MGGGSSSSSKLPPPPTPTPDVDVAASAAEQALMGQQVQSYKSALEDERKKSETGTLGAPAAKNAANGGGYGMRPKRQRSSASMMTPASGSMASSAVLTG